MIQLSKLQINYLLYLIEYKDQRTITGVANYFSCSRANAKKNLDKMIPLGLLYRVDKSYQLTDYARKIALSYLGKREDLSFFLKENFSLEDEIAKKLANETMMVKAPDFFDQVKKKAKILRGKDQIGLEKRQWSSEDLKKCLPPGTYPLLLTIYHLPRKGGIGANLDMNQLDVKSQMTIHKKIQIQVKGKNLIKIHQGFDKQKSYEKERHKEEVESKDSIFNLDLGKTQTWTYLGQGILATSLPITIESLSGLSKKIHQVIAIFILNLYQI